MNEQPIDAIAAAAWPQARVAEAIEALARRAGLRPRPAASSPPAPEPADAPGFEHWLDHFCSKLGLEVEAVDAHGGELSATLRAAAPALLRVSSDGVSGYLLLLGASGRHLQLLRPDLHLVRIPLEVVRAALCAHVEAPARAEIDALLARSELPARRRAAVQRTLVQERSAAQRFAGIWLLRLPPSTSAWAQLTRERVPSRLVLMLGIFALLYGLEIAGWALIGRGALAGRLDAGWLLAWALLLLGMVPLRMAGGWLQGALSIDAGLLLKQRLLSGALQMDMQQVRQQGAGQLLSRVIESQALESLALNGGFAVLLAALELMLAGWVLAHGAGGGWHASLLVLWLGVGAWFAARYHRTLQGWTSSRLHLTQELIERMVGHRTRLVQRAAHTHLEEDGELDRYLETSQHLDGAFVPLAAGLPRGWLLVGLIGLAPVLVAGNATPTALAIALGGVLLGYRALAAVSFGIAALLRAAIAAKEVAPMFKAAAREPAHPALLTSAVDGNAGQVLVQARELVYRHRANSEPVLDGCNLTIQRGDRILLEGSSGGGKSTLASLLVGLRQPDAGLLLLDGLDQATLGDSWRRSSTGAPQFHENHVLTGPFAFNLLMGRGWPASEADMREADALCRELGLGELIDRMPSGLMQIVGETGWQLSHGERSRMYLARALLQKSELVVLDESFAALDPDTLDRCLRCALKQSSTLMVIAHP